MIRRRRQCSHRRHRCVHRIARHHEPAPSNRRRTTLPLVLTLSRRHHAQQCRETMKITHLRAFIDEQYGIHAVTGSNSRTRTGLGRDCALCSLFLSSSRQLARDTIIKRGTSAQTCCFGDALATVEPECVCSNETHVWSGLETIPGNTAGLIFHKLRCFRLCLVLK